MENKAIIKLMSRHTEYLRLLDAMKSSGGAVSVFGLGEAHRIHTAACLYSDSKKTLLFITPSSAAASKAYEDILHYIPDALLFPARELPLNVQHYTESSAITSTRLNCMMQLMEGGSPFIVTSIEAMMQRMAPPELLLESVHSVSIGMQIRPEALLKKLIEAGYVREDLCEAPGQVTLRGGYLDVFPITAKNPVRIEFFDDEVDTLREFDAISQRSTENISMVNIPPATELPLNTELRRRGIAALRNKPHYAEETEILRSGGNPDNTMTLLPVFCRDEISLQDYLPKDSMILIDEPSRVEESAKLVFSSFLDGLSSVLQSGGGHELQEGLVHSALSTISRLETPATALLFSLTRSYGLIKTKELIRFETHPVSRYLGRAELIRDDILLWKQKGTTVLIFAGKHGQRLKDSLYDLGVYVPYVERLGRDPIQREIVIIGESIPRGFEYPELRFAAVSEYELYGTESFVKAKSSKKRIPLAFSDLEIGDLIVHETHGIGRFTGVKMLTVEGRSRDYIELVYLAGDKLFIPTDQLDRVQKYIGGDETKQKLSRLGSGEWQKTVARTRESAKKLAFDLVKLYSDRNRLRGFSFSPDTDWQVKLESSFPHTETDDQLTSIAEIKADMESDRIMDRLLCGDVGYGKTEVALRAAFKCAMDGKQCAVLVPTTILAQQHYNTFSSRFSGFPVSVELLSRFNTPGEYARIKENLKDGFTDIVIGTHSILGKSVKFYDLGLLIIDEEQRFGVNHKEQIKDLKRNVDVLTLSATPIPRTLHMSLSGIRDMSVIETPPEARYPVQTYVCEFNEPMIREAILKELARGGQVYFVYNIVKTMDLFAESLKQLVPEARIAYAHGQMGERQLEKTMLEFLEGKFDVLLCSTIIESGLDIPNVNTMIVYDSDRLGLSQLYQLRGRVGRGSRLGYAYLTYRKDKVLNEIADKRLSAIKEFTQFGAGFKIAMRDLEIRGAGEVLGAEQSGHMAAVGYELYCKLIDRAIKEVKNEPIKQEIDTAMEIPVDAHIPIKYISRENGRIAMYKRIASICDLDSLRDVQDELIDRYGDIPRAVQNLLDISLYKSRAEQCGISTVTVKSGEARLVFMPDPPIDTTKFFDVVKSTEGAQLGMKNLDDGIIPSTVLFVRRKNNTPEQMFDAVKKVLNAICRCVRE